MNPKKSSQTETILIDLEPIGRRVEISPGTDLLTAARQAGVDIVAVCGGVGVCGACRVRMVEGELSPLTQSEEKALSKDDIQAGFRLACQAKALSDVRLEIPPESLPTAQKLQVSGEESWFENDPAVCVVDLDLVPPALDDLRSDLTRVKSYLDTHDQPAHFEATLARLRELSETLRGSDWQARLVLQLAAGKTPRLNAVLPTGERVLGLAVDMGSTKLAAYLIDLLSGATLGQIGEMNPQIAYGEDVVSRIAFSNESEENRKLLQTRLSETLNKMITDLCSEAGVRAEQIVESVLVGNTAMHHFYAGLPVEQLGAAPYVPSVSDALDIRAAETGLKIAPDGRTCLPPNIAGYVGADHTSALLASLNGDTQKPLVLVDIGTNTEISLVTSERILACSTASGPAFEGAHIRDGMRAAPGAIEDMSISDEGVTVSTIANEAPVGICGTGILKAMAEMRGNELLSKQGTLNKKDERVRVNGRKAEFVLVDKQHSGHGREILVSRKDVNEIQLAKGAIRAGIEILLEEAGLKAEDVQRWVIAGAFGTYLDLASAVRIGMFPDVPLERFAQVGNAAGMGAKQMLLSKRKRAEARELAEQVEYIELTTYTRFTEVYVESMYF